MRGAMRTKKRLWRWRSNPLRRHEDIVEAWIVLAVWALVLVGGAVAGLVTANAADRTLAEQRALREPVRAVLVADVPDSTAVVGTSGDRRMATVRWTADDGTTRTGQTLVSSGHKAGSAVVVWQDDRGRLTTAPPGSTEAAFEAALLGTAAACALAGLAAGAGAVARWQLDRRRLDQWGREWAVVGPRWGHKTS